MKRVHIVGRKGSGKTTLVVELVRELAGRGLRVGTLKHSPHAHEVDVPGTDSFRHRRAGAAPAAFLCEGWTALFLPREAEADPYRAVADRFAACALVLVEGDLESSAPKVEIWREGLGSPPLCREREDLRALITDDTVEVALPVWPRREVARIADGILEMGGR